MVTQIDAVLSTSVAGDKGATETDIDIIFGWLENFYSAKMQMHYESKFDREKRKVVTMMI